MFRNESDLLSSLVKAVKSMKMTQNNDYFNDINKYRDTNGMINLTNVKDMNEINRIIDLVDKKNFIEELENSTNLQEKAEGLASVLKDVFDVDKVKVSISTPDGESFAKIGFEPDEWIREEKEDNTFEKKPLVDECSSVKCETNEDEKVNNDVKNETNVLEDDFVDETDGRVVVLHSVGGDVFNAPFYNAVLHICENEHFPECGVYDEDDLCPEDVDIHLLLPNIWGKMLVGAVEYFIERMNNGEKVYVVDPEFFDLEEITNPNMLWDFVMTKTQENLI